MVSGGRGRASGRAGESFLIARGDLPQLFQVIDDSGRRGVREIEGLVEWSRGQPAGLTHPPPVRDETVADLVIQGRR